MRKLLILSVAVATMASCVSNNSANVEIKTPIDSLSNAVGTLMGSQFKQMFKGIELNSAIIMNAMEKEMKSTEEGSQTAREADDFLRHYMMVIVPAQKAEKAAEYLKSIEKKSGIQKTDSGLMYEIIKEGDVANKPTAEDTVVAHYKGVTIDGTEFDSSYKRGEPATFPLTGVIKGWTEGLQLIGKGGSIKLYIPSDLAYGNGGGPLAGEVLIFDVELVDVKKAETEKK